MIFNGDYIVVKINSQLQVLNYSFLLIQIMSSLIKSMNK